MSAPPPPQQPASTSSSSSVVDPRKSLEQVFQKASIVYSSNSPQRRPMSRGSRSVASPGFTSTTTTRSSSNGNMLDTAREGNIENVENGIGINGAVVAGETTTNARPESRDSNWEGHLSRSPLFKHSLV